MSKAQVLKRFASVRLFFQTLWQLVIPYWKSSECWGAYLLLAAIIGLNLGSVYMSIQFNQWQADFYDSLQALDGNALLQTLIRFCYLSGISTVGDIYNSYLTNVLKMKWRRWLTMRYITNWLGKQSYYHMQLFRCEIDNPDQRISEDIDRFIDMTFLLSVGFLNSVTTLFSFLMVLWQLSGVLAFEVSGIAIAIPGYMVWLALIYSVIDTWITLKIGKKLIKLNINQQKYEANLRFSMIRLRENGESIAFYKGETQEYANFLGHFTAIVGNYWQIIKRQRLLDLVSSAFDQTQNVVPYLIALPSLFARKVKIGGVMQAQDAFSSVQGSLSFISNSYDTIAELGAVMERLQGFTREAESSHIPSNGFQQHMTAEKLIQADDITIKLPDGRTLLEHINLSIKPGDSLLITAPSGTGKSILLRTLVGLWPFVEGQLTMPTSADMMFLPQKPYMPMGTLRQAICYPNSPDEEEEKLREVLSLCQLDTLAGDLDETKQWSHILSIGEQQRIAFARILLAKPEFIFMDEATSALDETSEAQLYEILKSCLPDAAIISIGHRKSLNAWHKTEIAL